MLRMHGSKKKYYHDILGTNSRLDALQAAVLRVKLRHRIPGLLAAKVARRCRRLFAEQGLASFVTCPPQPPAKFHDVYNQFTIRAPQRDGLKEALRLAGIPTEIYYPLCLHLQPAFHYLGYQAGALPGRRKGQQGSALATRLS